MLRGLAAGGLRGLCARARLRPHLPAFAGERRANGEKRVRRRFFQVRRLYEGAGSRARQREKGRMETLVQPVLAFIAAHANWAVLVVFLISFGESFFLVGIAFPGTSLLVAAGALVAAGTLPALPILAGAVLGVVLGDGISYWLGRRFGRGIDRVWPFRANPNLLQNGVRFFSRHGGKSVFIGRFFGPMRATVPLAAGLLRMPADRFWFATIASAVLWAPMLLYLGNALALIGERFFGSQALLLILFAGFVFVAALAGLWAFLRPRREGG